MLTIAIVFAYVTILFFKPRSWLILLPALIPVLDLTPWQGLNVINAFDVLVLVTFIVALIFRRVDFSVFKRLGELKLILALLFISYIISTFLGFNHNSQNALASFYLFTADVNAIRLAKGFFEAVLLLPLLNYEKNKGTEITKLFSYGIFSGVLLALVIVVWERFIFTGLFDFSTPFSLTGLFSSALVGGASLDTFLVMSFPFIAVVFYLTDSKPIKILAVFLLMGTIYALFVTYSRSNMVALLIMMALYGLGHYRYIYQSESLIARMSPLIIGIIILLSLAIMLKGDFIKKRLHHWKNAIELTQSEQFSYLFGMGKGTYANTYLSQDLAGIGMARFWLKDKNTTQEPSSYLRFGPSDKTGDLRVLQRANLSSSGRHEVIITLRNAYKKKQKLLVEFCAKNYLTFSSRCEWRGFDVPKKQAEWIEVKKTISGKYFTEKRLSSITPFTVDLLNRGLAFGLDIKSVRVIDPNGEEILANTSFDTFDHWLFSSAQHEAWTVHSLFLDAYFEGGGIELLLMLLLMVGLLAKTYVLAQKGNLYGVALVTSFSGFYFIGLFSSVLNDPKISFLFFSMVFLLLLRPEKPTLSKVEKIKLMPYVIGGVVVVMLAASVNVLLLMSRKNMGVTDLVSYAQKEGEKKLKIKQKPYEAVLSSQKIEHWLGQGANKAHNSILTMYDDLGRPLSLNENTVEPLAINVIKVNTVGELKKALKTIRPGFLIEMAPGEYTLKGLTVNKKATPLRPNILFAKSLGDVVIKFTGVEGFKVSAPYWTFQNLIIEGACKTHSQCQHAFHIVGDADGTIIRNNVMTDFNAAIKSNGNGKGDYPDQVLIEKNTFSNRSPRDTNSPVTPIDVVGGNDWRVKANSISDFIKLRGNRVAMGAFLKGYSKRGVFEENLIQCNRMLFKRGHAQVGLSFGGGGTGKRYCFDGKCEYEHDGGIIRNNIIQNCNDVGIYLNKSKNTLVMNNTLVNTHGIDARFPKTDAIVINNVLNGAIRNRNLAQLVEKNNLVLNDPLGFKKWFVDVEQSNFMWKSTQGLPKYRSINTTDFCGRPVPKGSRLVGALTQRQDEVCKMLVSGSFYE